MSSQKGKWGERKTASGAQGILIKALIVMARAQRQNKNTGEEERMVTESEGWADTSNGESD